MLKIPTDETLRSMFYYGQPDYPVTYYCERLNDYKEHLIDWHWHWQFEFTLVCSGCLVFHSDSEQVSLSEGDCMFINSGTIHSFSNVSDAVLFNLIFSPEFIAPNGSLIFSKYVQPFLISDCAYLTLKHERSTDCNIIQHLSNVFQEIHEPAPARELKLAIQIKSIWKLLWEQNEEHLCADNFKKRKLLQARLHKMMDYIHSNYPQHLLLDDVANAANISKREALRCFKLGLQMTPINYLNHYRLRHAAEMLSETSKTVETIAISTGFHSVSYFCRIFRQKYGCTPMHYRMSTVNI